jgi:hypothetical protein
MPTIGMRSAFGNASNDWYVGTRQHLTVRAGRK